MRSSLSFESSARRDLTTRTCFLPLLVVMRSLHADARFTPARGHLLGVSRFFVNFQHKPHHVSFASNTPGAHLMEVVPLPDVGPQLMWPDVCVEGTPGAELHSSITLNLDEITVTIGRDPGADSLSGLRDGTAGRATVLHRMIGTHGITDVFLCGPTLDYSILHTALDISDLPQFVNVFVVEDASVGVAQATCFEALQRMEMERVRAIASTDHIISSMPAAPSSSEALPTLPMAAQRPPRSGLVRPGAGTALLGSSMKHAPTGSSLVVGSPTEASEGHSDDSDTAEPRTPHSVSTTPQRRRRHSPAASSNTDQSRQIHLAVKHNNVHILNQLLRSSGSPSLINECLMPRGMNALHIACMGSRLSVVTALLEAGADPNARTVNGETPLLLAVEAEKNAVVARLLANSPPAMPSRADHMGRTPLMAAALRSNPKVVALLLDAEERSGPSRAAVYAMAADKYQVTALMLACAAVRHDNEGLGEWAAVGGADDPLHKHLTRRKGSRGSLASRPASANSSGDLSGDGEDSDESESKAEWFFGVLTRKDILRERRQAANVLYARVSECVTHILQRLDSAASRVAALRHQDNQGWSALHFAAKSGAAAVLQWAILGHSLSSVPVNLLTSHGVSMLHLSSWNGVASVVALLLSRNAWSGGRNPWRARALVDQGVQARGHTPLDLALVRGHIDCARVLVRGRSHTRVSSARLCDEFLHRVILHGDGTAAELYLRNANSALRVNPIHVGLTARLKYPDTCTFTFAGEHNPVPQHMYECMSCGVRVCQMCRNKCHDDDPWKFDGYKDHDVRYVGLLTAACGCEKSTCAALTVVARREAEGYRYVPNPIDTSSIAMNFGAGTLWGRLTDRLAHNSHEVWAQERVAAGWQWGDTRDNQLKLHPSLVPFSYLSDEMKWYDLDSARQMLKVVRALGFTITPPDDEDAGADDELTDMVGRAAGMAAHSDAASDDDFAVSPKLSMSRRRQAQLAHGDVSSKTLDEILHDRAKLEAFTEFSNTIFCAENINFWVAVADFKRTKGTLKRQEKGKRIIEQFVVVGSEQCVNMPEALRQDLKQSVNGACEANTFALAEVEVYKDMVVDVLPRFLRSSQWRLVLQKRYESMEEGEVSAAEAGGDGDAPIPGDGLEFDLDDLAEAAASYKPEPIDTSDVELGEDIAGLVELLSKNTHELWADAKIKAKWRYAPDRVAGTGGSGDEKTSPMLVPYEYLTEKERRLPRSSALQMVKAIAKLGYKVQLERGRKSIDPSSLEHRLSYAELAHMRERTLGLRKLKQGLFNAFLFSVSRNGQEDMLDLLLSSSTSQSRRQGAIINCQDEMCRTPLFLAVQRGDFSTTAALLNFGARVTQRDVNGTTPLAIAAYKGHAALTQLLLEKGASVSARDSARMTPLHWAAYADRAEVCVILARHLVKADGVPGVDFLYSDLARDRINAKQNLFALTVSRSKVVGAAKIVASQRGVLSDAMPSKQSALGGSLVRKESLRVSGLLSKRRSPAPFAVDEEDSKEGKVYASPPSPIVARTSDGKPPRKGPAERRPSTPIDAPQNRSGGDENGSGNQTGLVRAALTRRALVTGETTMGGSEGADATADRCIEMSPLALATYARKTDAARVLIHFGANPLRRDGSEISPYERALKMRCTKSTRLEELDGYERVLTRSAFFPPCCKRCLVYKNEQSTSRIRRRVGAGSADASGPGGVAGIPSRGHGWSVTRRVVRGLGSLSDSFRDSSRDGSADLSASDEAVLRASAAAEAVTQLVAEARARGSSQLSDADNLVNALKSSTRVIEHRNKLAWRYCAVPLLFLTFCIVVIAWITPLAPDYPQQETAAFARHAADLVRSSFGGKFSDSSFYHDHGEEGQWWHWLDTDILWLQRGPDSSADVDSCMGDGISTAGGGRLLFTVDGASVPLTTMLSQSWIAGAMRLTVWNPARAACSLPPDVGGAEAGGDELCHDRGAQEGDGVVTVFLDSGSVDARRSAAWSVAPHWYNCSAFCDAGACASHTAKRDPAGFMDAAAAELAFVQFNPTLAAFAVVEVVVDFTYGSPSLEVSSQAFRYSSGRFYMSLAFQLVVMITCAGHLAALALRLRLAGSLLALRVDGSLVMHVISIVALIAIVSLDAIKTAMLSSLVLDVSRTDDQSFVESLPTATAVHNAEGVLVAGVFVFLACRVVKALEVSPIIGPIVIAAVGTLTDGYVVGVLFLCGGLLSITVVALSIALGPASPLFASIGSAVPALLGLHFLAEWEQLAVSGYQVIAAVAFLVALSVTTALLALLVGVAANAFQRHRNGARTKWEVMLSDLEQVDMVLPFPAALRAFLVFTGYRPLPEHVAELHIRRRNRAARQRAKKVGIAQQSSVASSLKDKEPLPVPTLSKASGVKNHRLFQRGISARAAVDDVDGAKRVGEETKEERLDRRVRATLATMSRIAEAMDNAFPQSSAATARPRPANGPKDSSSAKNLLGLIRGGGDVVTNRKEAATKQLPQTQAAPAGPSTESVRETVHKSSSGNMGPSQGADPSFEAQAAAGVAAAQASLTSKLGKEPVKHTAEDFGTQLRALERRLELRFSAHRAALANVEGGIDHMSVLLERAAPRRSHKRRPIRAPLSTVVEQTEGGGDGSAASETD